MSESIFLSEIWQASTSFQEDSFNVHLLSIIQHRPFLFLFYLLGIKYAATLQTVAKVILTGQSTEYMEMHLLGAPPISSPGLAVQRPLNDLISQLLKPRRQL